MKCSEATWRRCSQLSHRRHDTADVVAFIREINEAFPSLDLRANDNDDPSRPFSDPPARPR